MTEKSKKIPHIIDGVSRKGGVQWVVTHFHFLPSYSMARGSIKRKTDQGFGFISVEGSNDVFFHHSACGGQYDSLQVGQAVQFDIEQGERGPKAKNVVGA